jgi:hypothetical protein
MNVHITVCIFLFHRLKINHVLEYDHALILGPVGMVANTNNPAVSRVPDSPLAVGRTYCMCPYLDNSMAIFFVTEHLTNSNTKRPAAFRRPGRRALGQMAHK